MRLYIDLETIPSQRDDAMDGIIVEAPANYKKPETIQKWLDENYEAERQKKYQKFGLDGALGEIICIGYAIDDNPPEVIGRKLGEPESEMLSAFMDAVYEAKHSGNGPHAITWIGHNVISFDLRFLWQRFVANSIRPKINIPIDAKPWEATAVFDTMTQWTGARKSGTGKLDTICKALGLSGKDGIDGSMVWDYIRESRYTEVFEYCADDVELTRALHKKLIFED